LFPNLSLCPLITSTPALPHSAVPKDPLTDCCYISLSLHKWGYTACIPFLCSFCHFSSCDNFEIHPCSFMYHSSLFIAESYCVIVCTSLLVHLLVNIWVDYSFTMFDHYKAAVCIYLQVFI
jgi:hypothetical protein